MRRKYPNVVTSVRLLNSTDVAAQVRAGEADLGFVEGPTAPDGLRAVEVAHDELVVIVPPDHKWIARARSTPVSSRPRR